MRPQISTIAAACLLLIPLSTSRCLSGDATFSNDGQRIYVIADIDDKSALEEIDIKGKTIRRISFAEFSALDSVRGIACTQENRFYLTTDKALWALEPASGRTQKVRDAGPGESFWRVAYNSKMQKVFVTTDSEQSPLFMFADPKEWIAVRMRRHPFPSCLVFAKSGELFFAAYGDLWHGEIQKGEFDGKTEYSVTAYRCAPLATLETENSTPAEIGVRDIGVARDEIYLQLARMGGSGDGWFARLARPIAKRLEEGSLDILYGPEHRLPVYQRSISSLRILGDDYQAGKIAVSPDERRVHYVMHNKHWLVTDGKTEEMHLTQK